MLADLIARRDRLAADLAELDAAIAVVRRVLGGDAPAPAPEVVAPGKPEPRPAPKAPGDAAPVAVRVARHLAATGPQRVRQMVAAGLACQPTVNKAIRNNPTWFRRAGNGLMAPWGLTEAGREMASTATRNGEPH